MAKKKSKFRIVRAIDIPYARVEDIGKIPNEMITVRTQDGDVDMWSRWAMWLRILWQPLVARKIPITKEDVPTDIFPIKKGTCVDVLSNQYARLLDQDPELNHVALMVEYMHCIYHLQYTAHAQLGDYVTSIDLLDLIQTMRSPELDEIVRKPLETHKGVLFVERDLKERGKQLMKLISTPGALTTNKIWPHAVSGAFKDDQFSQLCIAYGPRSDITDEVLPHIMTCSGISGMRSVEDMVTESSSSKKSTYFNTTIICDAQTLHTCLKLAVSALHKMYPLSEACGNSHRVSYVVREGYSRNFLNKVCWLDGKKRVITRDNHTEFAGKTIEVLDVSSCEYTDGICARCAGRAPNEEWFETNLSDLTEEQQALFDYTWPHVWKYFPDIKLAKYVVSEICRMLSQKVLSTKHIVMVILAILKLSKQAKLFYRVDVIEDKDTERVGLFFQDELWEDYMDGYLALPVDDIGHPKEVSDEDSTAMEYGVLTKCGFVHSPAERPKLFAIGEESSRHVLTKEFFAYMRQCRSQIVCPPPGTRHKNVYLVPLHGWDKNLPILETMDINDDMVAYVKTTENFFRSKIATYDSVSSAIQGLTDFLYRKSNPNIFFVEVLFKAFVAGGEKYAKEGDAALRGFKEHLTDTAVSNRLSLGYCMEYLRAPETATEPKPSVDEDWLYGWPEA